jgi:hypothetical protein
MSSGRCSCNYLLSRHETKTCGWTENVLGPAAASASGERSASFAIFLVRGHCVDRRMLVEVEIEWDRRGWAGLRLCVDWGAVGGASIGVKLC